MHVINTEQLNKIDETLTVQNLQLHDVNTNVIKISFINIEIPWKAE